MRVAGIFETGFYDEDMNWSYTSIQTAQKIFELEDVVNSIELRLDDVFKAPQVEKEAENVIGPKLGAITWEEQNRQILSALRAERIVTVITMGLIQIVARFEHPDHARDDGHGKTPRYRDFDVDGRQRATNS